MPRYDLVRSDLQAGDLVIWKMGEGSANHVELYTGTSHFTDTSIHAVYAPAKDMTRVMPTSFSGAQHKHIFRCLKPHMAADVVALASSWARYENRYDKPRIDVKTAFRDMHRNMGTTDDEMAILMIHRFMDVGRFRAIKYAARRSGVLCYPGDDGNSGHGMTCCMFAILCFQVAGIASQVNRLDPAQPLTRVSDKKMDANDLVTLKRHMSMLGFPSKVYYEYAHYVGRIQEQNEYRIDWAKAGKPEVQKGPATPKQAGFTFYPSILMWNDPQQFGAFDWPAAITPGMMLDAKIANPQHVWDSLRGDPEHWNYVGSMVAEQVQASAEEKATYAGTIAANKAAATLNRGAFVRH